MSVACYLPRLTQFDDSSRVTAVYSIFSLDILPAFVDKGLEISSDVVQSQYDKIAKKAVAVADTSADKLKSVVKMLHLDFDADLPFLNGLAGAAAYIYDFIVKGIEKVLEPLHAKLDALIREAFDTVQGRDVANYIFELDCLEDMGTRYEKLS